MPAESVTDTKLAIWTTGILEGGSKRDGAAGFFAAPSDRLLADTIPNHLLLAGYDAALLPMNSLTTWLKSAADSK